MDKTLIIAALNFRRCSLFETLNDSQIFAVKLQDGPIDYCCCMGNGGEHYALALYRGSEGFDTYLNSIKASHFINPLDFFENQMTFHAINCDYENAADCLTSKEDRAFIKKVASEEGIKMCRSKGWPDFHVMDGSVLYEGIPDETDRREMTFALQAGCEVARKIEGLDYRQLSALGFDDDYATDRGGKNIPLLSLKPDGKWLWDKIPTPALTDKEFHTPLFDNPSATPRISAMRHQGTFECRVLHSPMPVAEGNTNTRYYPVGLLTVVKPEGFPPFIPSFIKEKNNWETDILDGIAEGIINSGICPRCIETDDELTYALLQDFCKKTGIKLNKIANARLILKLAMFMQTMMR